MGRVLQTGLSLLLLFVAYACEKSGESGVPASAAFRTPTINCETTTVQLLLGGDASLACTAEVVEGSDWLLFSSGEARWEGMLTPVVFLRSERNTAPEARQARVEVRFSNGDVREATLTQEAYTSSALYDKAWAEQPAYVENDIYIYKTYYTTLSGSSVRVRNYSVCYDTEQRVARWVAYPLHSCYTNPSVDRTDAWSYDPNTQPPEIPRNVQQYIVESYGTGYARGHQCPSADRYNTEATNEMTFYATNMMPQDYRFNSGLWATLESRVRSSMVRDTLYVVTGTSFDGRTTTDRKGDRIGLPSHCWKVLLRTRSGNTGKPVAECSADELMGIGFWFENSASSNGSLRDYACSIAEVEERTGFSFFRNLPAEVAAEVKAQVNTSAWNL